MSSLSGLHLLMNIMEIHSSKNPLGKYSAYCVMSEIFHLHSEPTAFLYAVDVHWKWLFHCWGFQHSVQAVGSPRVGCSRCLVDLVKDGWEWSKYCSDFPSGLYRWFGRVTRQTGPGIKAQPLFHGGLALSLSLDYTCCVTRVQPFRLIYQSNDQSILPDITVASLWQGSK